MGNSKDMLLLNRRLVTILQVLSLWTDESFGLKPSQKTASKLKLHPRRVPPPRVSKHPSLVRLKTQLEMDSKRMNSLNKAEMEVAEKLAALNKWEMDLKMGKNLSLNASMTNASMEKMKDKITVGRQVLFSSAGQYNEREFDRCKSLRVTFPDKSQYKYNSTTRYYEYYNPTNEHIDYSRRHNIPLGFLINENASMPIDKLMFDEEEPDNIETYEASAFVDDGQSLSLNQWNMPKKQSDPNDTNSSNAPLRPTGLKSKMVTYRVPTIAQTVEVCGCGFRLTLFRTSDCAPWQDPSRGFATGAGEVRLGKCDCKATECDKLVLADLEFNSTKKNDDGLFTNGTFTANPTNGSTNASLLSSSFFSQFLQRRIEKQKSLRGPVTNPDIGLGVIATKDGIISIGNFMTRQTPNNTNDTNATSGVFTTTPAAPIVTTVITSSTPHPTPKPEFWSVRVSKCVADLSYNLYDTPRVAKASDWAYFGMSKPPDSDAGGDTGTTADEGGAIGGNETSNASSQSI